MGIVGTDMRDFYRWRSIALVGGPNMKHYRVNKLAKANGVVVKRKDILAKNDHEAVQAVKDDADCPICDVLREGRKIASIV